MSGLSDRNAFKIAVFFYGLSLLYSVLLWKRGFKRTEMWNYGFLAGAFIFHSIAMVKRGFSLERCPINNLYEATTFITWTIVLGYLVVGAWPRLRFLGAFGAPLFFSVGIFSLMPDLDRHFSGETDFGGGFVSLHAAAILLSYGAFGLAAVSSLVYVSADHDLKFDKMRALMSELPSVDRLDRVNCLAMGIGLALLTIGLLMGVRISVVGEMPFVSDPKVKWSLLVWLIYLGMLMARFEGDFGGRIAMGTSLPCFCFLLLNLRHS